MHTPHTHGWVYFCILDIHGPLPQRAWVKSWAEKVHRCGTRRAPQTASPSPFKSSGGSGCLLTTTTQQRPAGCPAWPWIMWLNPEEVLLKNALKLWAFVSCNFLFLCYFCVVVVVVSFQLFRLQANMAFSNCLYPHWPWDVWGSPLAIDWTIPFDLKEKCLTIYIWQPRKHPYNVTSYIRLCNM